MLVGNKCDRVTEREVSTQEGGALARELGCDFVEASAKNRNNVEKAFYDVVRQLRKQRQQSYRTNSHKSRGEPNSEPSGSCRGYSTRGDRTEYPSGGGSGAGQGTCKCVVL